MTKLVALPQTDAHQRRTAYTDQEGHRAHHSHYRTTYAYTGQRNIAHFRNIADVHSVHDAV